MKELNKTNRLTIVVVAIVLVIIAGLITLRRPDVQYVLTPDESVALLNDTSARVTPLQSTVLLKDSSGKIVFIDVRNSIAFDKGHVKNAMNIPVRELFSKKSKSIFREIENNGQTAVIYGENQQQASGPWFMLRQTGFKNIKLFTGNFAQLDLSQPDSITSLLPQISEIPMIDTAALNAVKGSAVTDKITGQKPATDKKKVVPVKKDGASGGGC